MLTQMNGYPLQIVGLKLGTKLYHYISFDYFVSWVDSGCIVLRQVVKWDDPWEQPLRTARYHDGDDKSRKPLQKRENAYGQCWTRDPESDAMWRVYSQTKQALRICTTAARFRLLKGFTEAVLAPVKYSNSPGYEVLRPAKRIPDSYIDAFIKRLPFQHEHEVRLIVYAESVTEPGEVGNGLMRLPLDPVQFVEQIELDPRAADWFVCAVKGYCADAGLSCVPRRSGLYSDNPYEAGLLQNGEPESSILPERRTEEV